MKRIVTVLAVLLLTSVAGCIGSWTAIMEEGFEEGFTQWQVGNDLPMDPDTGAPVEAYVRVVDTIVRSGDRSVELGIDGHQDDGTIWIQRALIPGEGGLEVEIGFYIYSASESFNVMAHPLAYLGLVPPGEEEDFTTLGNANSDAGWLFFSHSDTFTLDENDELWLAVGITAVWETCLVYRIDDIRVSVR